jgi:pimeloyl-ACP methyl ester carboxylesterase
VKVNGASLGYRTVGSGPPLVMVMGFGATMSVWDPALIERLARRHRVIMFDNRGVGESAGAPIDPGSPRAVQPKPWVMKILNDPNTSPEDLVRILFPPKRQWAGSAWLQRIVTWPGVTAQSYEVPPETLAAQTRAEGPLWLGPGRGAFARLPTIRKRTLVAAGRRDIVEPPKNSRLIARRISDARLKLYRMSGHAFLAQLHDRFARHVVRFLDRR